MILLAMAALVLAGMAGCTGGELVEEQPEGSKTVTLTTTVGLDASTKALTPTGVKTFAEGETMAVIYNNGTSKVKAVSHALEAGDITNEGKSATFTFDLETPNTSVDVTYIYPAAMAGETGVDYSKLDSQDGTLASLSSNLDLATQTAAWEGTSLPAATLVNELAILAITLKDSDGSNGLGNITGMTVSDGTNTYTVTPQAPATELTVPVYVAIRPTSDATITVTSTDGTTNYVKTLTGKTYVKSNGYDVSWRMYEVWESNEYKEGAWDGSKVVFTKKTATNPTVLTNSDSGVNLEGGWYTVTGDNVVINGDVKITGETHLILCDGAKLTVNGYFYGKGISYGEGNLYIFGQHAGTGTLNVYNVNGSGQGAITVDNMLQIHGGNINVSGSWSVSAGLFVGHNNAVVFGGKLTVENTNPVGAGTVYGIQMLGGDLNVYGGEVIASSKNKAIYIGNKTVTVFGGKLMAINPDSNFGDRAIDGYVKSGVSGIKFYFSIDAESWSEGETYAEAARVPEVPYVKAE